MWMVYLSLVGVWWLKNWSSSRSAAVPGAMLPASTLSSMTATRSATPGHRLNLAISCQLMWLHNQRRCWALRTASNCPAFWRRGRGTYSFMQSPYVHMNTVVSFPGTLYIWGESYGTKQLTLISYKWHAQVPSFQAIPDVPLEIRLMKH